MFQRANESLKDYISRFRREVSNIEDPSDESVLIANKESKKGKGEGLFKSSPRFIVWPRVCARACETENSIRTNHGASNTCTHSDIVIVPGVRTAPTAHQPTPINPPTLSLSLCTASHPSPPISLHITPHFRSQAVQETSIIYSLSLPLFSTVLSLCLSSPMGILIFALLAIWAAGGVESATRHMAPAPAPSVDCSTVILSMADCLSYVSSGSTKKKPEGTCCSGLKTVLKSEAECLCEAFKNSAQYGINLNVTKAMSLPTACHVSAPSIKNCGLSLVPGGAPASSPEAAPSPSAISAMPTVAEGPTGTAPALSPGSSDSTVLASSAGFLVLAMVAASLTSI
ncbi:uncharacterized protein LOC127809400 [Diospyros lotus]|uniref:uncharacterized protein LOC127809400 n=1 Tax=Diospyros lotus TaxID=55363 RepID=UPI002256E454|nr:uncharacterized protein LOC127809400 [Diospyros lotus]